MTSEPNAFGLSDCRLSTQHALKGTPPRKGESYSLSVSGLQQAQASSPTPDFLHFRIITSPSLSKGEEK